MSLIEYKHKVKSENELIKSIEEFRANIKGVNI